jgi:putative mRNA 3-end processing factor
LKQRLLILNDKGIFCEEGNFYIDPWRPVENALITHAHSDHSRSGHTKYLAHSISAPVMKLRLGQNINLQTIEYNKKLNINGVDVTFYPAGHIPGSAQILVEKNGEKWVVTGDFKTTEDGISTPFQPVKCHHLIMESTFGLPIYHWKKQSEIVANILQWHQGNIEKGKNSVLLAYALGKAQRLIKALENDVDEIFVHGAVHNVNEVLSSFISLPNAQKIVAKEWDKKSKGKLIIATPSAMGTPWMKNFEPYSIGITSGWMAVRGMRRRRSVDAGFVLSDHADWKGLNDAVEWSGAENVYVTHGYNDIFAKWLRESKKINAKSLKTLFTGDTDTDD